ncbi:hypothetical protein VaNZ11_007807, partial [Volvox africanus]
MVAKCRAVRALLPSVLNQVEQVIGRRFSFDARTVRAGFDGFCNLFEPQGRPLSSANLGGHTILFTPSSLCELQKQLALFRACKRQYPDTSACILLPEYVSRRNPSFLSGMQRVLRFNPGTALFHSLDMAGEVVQLPGSPYSVDVWFAAPKSVQEGLPETEPCISVLCLPKAAALIGAGVPLITVSTAGRTFTALADSGASDDFISASVVTQLGLKPS